MRRSWRKSEIIRPDYRECTDLILFKKYISYVGILRTAHALNKNEQTKITVNSPFYTA